MNRMCNKLMAKAIKIFGRRPINHVRNIVGNRRVSTCVTPLTGQLIWHDASLEYSCE